MAGKSSSKTPVITARKQPIQQRAKFMVESILQAAAHILERGNQPFTTNHIAERAGVSIGSLYQYFPSAEAIMASLIKSHVVQERAEAEAILASSGGHNTDTLRDLLIAFVEAHASSPRLSAQLHALAPSFGLQDELDSARDAQAARIASVLGLREEETIIAVMAVEGVVLAMLARDPARLKSGDFIDRLYTIALAALSFGAK